MKRNTIAVVFVAMLALSGVVVGASVVVDNMFEDTDGIAEDEITLEGTQEAVDAGYIGADDGDITIAVDEITSGAEVSVDDVLVATYNGNDNGEIYFETGQEGVNITDSDGEAVDSDNPAELTAEDDSQSFGVHIDDTTDAESMTDVSVSVEAAEPDEPPRDPVGFNGTVADEDDTIAPADTTIVGVNTETGETNSTTVNEDGVYGVSQLDEDIVLEVAEDDEILFYVRNADDGPLYVNDPTYTFSEDDLEDDGQELGIVEEDLTFEAGTFDLQVDDLQANASEVEQGETVNVNATLVNNGSLDLEQNVDLTINGDTVADLNKEREVDAGASEEVEFDYTFEDEEPDTYDVNIITEDDDDDDRALEITVLDAFLNIDNVDNAAFNLDFIGIVEDDDELGVTADNIQDDEEETIDDEQVTLSLELEDEDRVTLAENIEVSNGEIDAAVDPTDVPNDVETAQDANLVIEEFETDASVTLIDQVRNLSTGATATSAPLAAQLYFEGDFSATQWDESADAYSSSDIDPTGEFTDETSVHRGLFILTNDPDVRFGYEFQPAEFDEDATFELSEGWNLVSSNYNISDSGTPSVEDDLGLDVDYSDVSVVDANDRDNFPSAGDDSGQYNVYWVLTEDGEVTRDLDNSTYSP